MKIKFFLKYVDKILLLGIVLFAIWLRLATANVDIILDYDPWLWFRKAEEILNNNFLPKKWDILSYFPPGRPNEYQLGWSYTLVGFYILAKTFIANLTFIKFSIYFVAIFSGLCAIPAYFVGKIVTNKWGGLITAFFAVITPTFLGVSMAGYPDSDAVDVFYTFLCVLTTLYAIKNYKGLKNKKSWFGIILALVSYWLFAFNWNTSWYIFYIFIVFIPIFVLFKIFESIIRKEKIGLSLLVNKIRENKNLIFVIVLIGVLGQIATMITFRWPFNTAPPLQQLLSGFNFLTGRALIVNISVAELQPINVFTKEGFLAVSNRIGIFPIILALVGMPLLVIYKLFYKKEIKIAEYFAIIWMIICFLLITRGVRFSLLFSMAIATASGFFVGSLVEFLKERKNLLVLSTVYGMILFGLIWHISDNILFSYQAGGMEVSQNWKDALNWLKANSDENTLITTWWDPGHIITGYSGLKVMADGAHCGDACYPYNHNIRIQDMGRVFSISNETEAINILQKYTGLTPQQCQELKQKFGDAAPPEACNKVSKMYIIASSDLIGKYYWLSYFGTGTGRNFIQLPISGRDASGNLVYGNILTLAIKDNQLVPIINIPQQGIINAVVKEIIFYQNGQERKFNYTNITNAIDGLVWVDPSFQIVIFMDTQIRDSIFTKMFFFDGKDLNNFEKVFENAEVKIYEVKF